MLRELHVIGIIARFKVGYDRTIWGVLFQTNLGSTCLVERIIRRTQTMNFQSGKGLARIIGFAEGFILFSKAIASRSRAQVDNVE